ncbi:MAG: hypothetical protein J6U00_04170 [Ruminococcus sp.]|uniref:hypothetical protein n=1 Tax=Ruminococcus sp. TaxID=41978 RepID=UPI001B2C6CC4|nr:hypothetical protein [Ruminococcus sp.]MBO7473187.1 hypothetical protein [Ruminococcus sp.]
MKRIEASGAVAFERWSGMVLFIIVAVLLLAASLFESARKPICGLALAVPLKYFIVFIAFIAVSFSPMTDVFDDQWLMMKNGMFRKDIRMDEITRVRYYIMLRKSRRPSMRFYHLVMEIEYQGGRQELMEHIEKAEIEYCKHGEANKELFALYNHIKELYPDKAKGYWEYCGI